MKKINKRLRFVAIVLCLVLVYFAFEPWNVVRASEQKSKRAPVREEAKKEKKPVERWEETIWEIHKVLECKLQNVKCRTKDEEVREKIKELYEVDKVMRDEFKKTEKFLKEKKLEVGLKRHDEFVKQYNSKFNELKMKLDEIIDCKMQNAKCKMKMKEVIEFIEKNQYKRKEKPIDPNKLPHRTAPIKEIPIIEQKDGETEKRKNIQLKNEETEKRKNIQLKNEETEKRKNIEQKDEETEKRKNGEESSASPHQGTRVQIQNTKCKMQNAPVRLAMGGTSDAFSIVANSEQQVANSEEDPYENPAYLAETPDVQITDEIRELATKTLKSNPVLIYEYVRNNFDYEPYYGSLKGSQQTLIEKAGNDFDLSSLLIALYRAAGIPARYVQGEIEIPIEKLMNLLGVKDPLTAGNIIATARIPAVGIRIGGKLKYIRMQHTWVEAYVDYIPSRGAVHKRGDTWIPLAPAIKQYEYKEGIDLKEVTGFDPEVFMNEIKAATTTINETESYVSGVPQDLIYSKLEEVQTRLQNYIETNMSNATIEDILGGRWIIKKEYGILPSSLPVFRITQILTKFASIPDEYHHKIKFSFPGVAFTINLSQLYNKRVTLSFIPASTYDEEIINFYDGIFNTPAYLIHLKSVLKIEGNIKAIGYPTHPGEQYDMEIETFSPPNIIEKDRYEVVVGSHYGIGIDLKRIYKNILERRKEILENNLGIGYSTFSDEILGECLFINVIVYFFVADVFNDISQKMIKVRDDRQPSVGISELKLSVEYLYGIPSSITPVGIRMDIIRDAHAAFSVTGDKTQTKAYMLSTGMNSSSLEYGVIEQLYRIESVSTVKILQIANIKKVPIYRIDQNNIFTVLPQLQVDDEVKTNIQNAINAQKIVIIPKTNIQVNQWSGTGYIILDEETGCGAYKISGGISGGETTTQIDWIVIFQIAEAIRVIFVTLGIPILIIALAVEQYLIGSLALSATIAVGIAGLHILIIAIIVVYLIIKYEIIPAFQKATLLNNKRLVKYTLDLPNNNSWKNKIKDG